MQRVESMLADWRALYDRAQQVRARAREAIELGDLRLADDLQDEANDIARQGEHLLKAIHERIGELRDKEAISE